MLDFGLLATGVVIVLVVTVASRWWPGGTSEPGDALDRLAVPVGGGLLAGRFVAALLDDPLSLRSLRAFLVIRGGVEFWPGVLVASCLLALGIRRRHRWRATDGLGPPTHSVLSELADLVPFALWGYAGYEATCLVRDGCYGPVSAVGLTPVGLRTTMLPVGLLVAIAVAALGAALRGLVAWSPASRVTAAMAGVAGVRSLASVWLPRLGPGLTRQHRESLGVLAATLLAGAWMVIGHHRRRADEVVRGRR